MSPAEAWGVYALVLGLDALALVMTWRASKRWPYKLLWTGAVIALPLLGCALWILLGPRPARSRRPS